MEFVGLDIGGANIKAVKLKYVNGRVSVTNSIREYFPIWIRGRESLVPKLREIRERLRVRAGEYVVSATMTAELSDIYRFKREGVEDIVNSVQKVYDDSANMFFINVYGKLVSAKEALNDPLNIASANWAASGWYLSKLYKNCILIDIGSTTTTIVPIVNGKINVKGYNDPEKLAYGELVYLGVLRTNVVAITDKIPYKGLLARVSSEKFALSGDVFLVLGKIREKEYTTETADGRGISFKECVERLSRIPCGDIEILSKQETIEIARYIYERAVFRIFEALLQVKTRLISEGSVVEKFPIIVAGLGEFLAEEAAKRAGFINIKKLSQIVGRNISNILPAYAAALMAMERI